MGLAHPHICLLQGSHLEPSRTLDDIHGGAGWLQPTQTAHIQMLNTHLLNVRPPSSMRESTSGDIPCGLDSEELGEGAVRCEDSYCFNFEMIAEQSGDKNQNHKH